MVKYIGIFERILKQFTNQILQKTLDDKFLEEFSNESLDEFLEEFQVEFLTVSQKQHLKEFLLESSQQLLEDFLMDFL